jgi:hypothetical protein
VRAADTREVPLAPGGTVEIQLSSADLRVRGTDTDRVVVRTRNGRPVDGQVRIEASTGLVRIREGDSGLRLGPVHITTRGSSDLDIDVPATATVVVRTLSGDVVADGIRGASRWTSAGGDLRVAVSGGSVAMETMSGDAILEAAGAVALTARTVSGDLRVRAPRLDAVRASTTSGDVHIEGDLDAGSAHVISSVSGDVEIVTASPVRLDTQTIAGDVRATGSHVSEGGRGRRVLVVGDGSVQVSVQTTSGDVKLQALGLRVPSSPPIPMPAPAPAAPSAPVPLPAPAPPEAPSAPEALGVPPEPGVVVAEAAASPNLMRAGSEAALPQGPNAESEVALTDPVEAAQVEAPANVDDRTWNGAPSEVDRREAARLDVLRALERGDLDVESASLRLEILEDAGPRAFRGWC